MLVHDLLAVLHPGIGEVENVGKKAKDIFGRGESRLQPVTHSLRTSHDQRLASPSVVEYVEQPGGDTVQVTGMRLVATPHDGMPTTFGRRVGNHRSVANNRPCRWHRKLDLGGRKVVWCGPTDWLSRPALGTETNPRRLLRRRRSPAEQPAFDAKIKPMRISPLSRGYFDLQAAARTGKFRRLSVDLDTTHLVGVRVEMDARHPIAQHRNRSHNRSTRRLVRFIDIQRGDRAHQMVSPIRRVMQMRRRNLSEGGCRKGDRKSDDREGFHECDVTYPCR